MGQSFQILENIAPLVKASGTTITMASTYLGKDTRISVGGQQYRASGTIILNTAAANGINALDTGALASNTLYYLYAVQSSGVLGIVASTAAPGTGPIGFGAWKEIGRFRTNFGSAAVNTVVNRVLGDNKSVTSIKTSSTSESIIVTATGSNPTYGTNTSKYNWSSINESMAIQFEFTQTTVGSSNGTGDYVVLLPTGYTIDLTKITPSTDNRAMITLGTAKLGTSGLGGFDSPTGSIVAYSSNSLAFMLTNDTEGARSLGSGATSTWLPSSTIWSIGFEARVPIAEWVGLLSD